MTIARARAAAKRASLRSLFEINVAACEAAKRPKCSCPCNGKLHGKKHSAAWRRQAFNDCYGGDE